MGEELTLIEEENEVPTEMFLRISGLLIEEEVDFLINLCKSTPREAVNSLPLFLATEGEEIKIGELELSLDNILTIYQVSNKYKLELVDNVNHDCVDLFSSEVKGTGEGFTEFIKL